MARLIYSAICSLDGYTVDAGGSFAWAAPDDEVHAFVNDLERDVGTYLYGSRMYEVMQFWQTVSDDHPAMVDYAAIWQAADKVVYSSTLTQVSTPRTRLERSFDPDLVAQLVRDSARDVSIGGATLAATAFHAGLVDECHLFLHPLTVGGGTPALPAGVRLELLDQRSFSSGVVHLHYAIS
jgi:dihydrofolate reductase